MNTMSRRWLARASFALILAAVALVLAVAGWHSLTLAGLTAIGVCAVLAGGYWFLANRGVLRWVALVLVVAAPVVSGARRSGVIGLFSWARINDKRQRSFVTGYPVTRHAEWARMGRETSGSAGMTGGACGVVVAGDRVGTTEWERPARLKFAA